MIISLTKFYSLAEQITRNVDILMIPDANIDTRLILFDDDSEQFRVDPDNQGEGDVSQTIEYWISPIESLADWNKFFLWKKLICCSYDRNKSSIYLLLKSLNNSFQNNGIFKTDHSDFLKMIDNVRILTFIHKLWEPKVFLKNKIFRQQLLTVCSCRVR